MANIYLLNLCFVRYCSTGHLTTQPIQPPSHISHMNQTPFCGTGDVLTSVTVTIVTTVMITTSLPMFSVYLMPAQPLLSREHH